MKQRLDSGSKSRIRRLATSGGSGSHPVPPRARKPAAANRVGQATGWVVALLYLFTVACLAWSGSRLWEQEQHRRRLEAQIEIWRAWPTSEGKILKAELSPLPNGELLPVIEYDYPLGSQRFANQRVYPTWEPSRQPEEARTLVSQFPLGSFVTVHLNPADPHVSYLLLNADEMRREVKAEGTTAWIVMAGALLWAAVVYRARGRLA